MIEVTLPEARRLAVAAQGLDGTAPCSVTEVVRALGSVQVDPVAAVARAERMVVFSRLGPYDVSELRSALDRGDLYEYWAHIVPASDYGIHRETMRRYRLEMYVPPAKREYGYYVLPVLHGSALIGRVDATFDRRAGVLRVDGVWAERGAPADAGPDVADALRELAAWLGAGEVKIGRRAPRAWAGALRA